MVTSDRRSEFRPQSPSRRRVRRPALWFNLLMAEGFSTMVFVGTVIATWPSPPWDTLQYVGPLEALITPFLFWPFARSLFLAFDLCIRPVEERDRT